MQNQQSKPILNVFKQTLQLQLKSKIYSKPLQPYKIKPSQKQMTQSPDYSSINIDFNNIHDADQLQRIVIQLKAIIQNKIKSINELSLVHEKQEEERQIVLRRMNESNENNKQKIEAYGQLIYSVSDSYSRFNKESQDEKQRQKKSIQVTHQTQMTEISRKIDDIQTEYKKLKEFEDLEVEYIMRIETMNKEIVSGQYQHNDGMNELQAIQIKENKELEERLGQEVAATHKTAPSHAINKISSELKTNQEQNDILKQKLFQLQSQLQKLKKQRNEIVNKRKQLKINVNLNEDQLEEYKAVGSLQKAKIKAYKDKLQAMKVMISDQVAKKEKALSQHKKQRETNLKTMKLKLFNMEKEKQNLRIKMQKINLLAETILQQRAEIEEFFVMALNSCKEEIEDFEKGKPIRGQEQKSYGEKVDIDELLPKDKQRILTNLYTKLAFGSK